MPLPERLWTGVRAVSFDVYGTLIDWEPEIATVLAGWSGRDRGAMLELYDRLRQPIQARRPALPYPEVLRETLRQMGRKLDLDVPAVLLDRFGRIAATHSPFPDTAPVLAALKGRGLTLAALSNIDEESFAALRANHPLPFDVVVTAERSGSYKPDPRHFRIALADLARRGISAAEVLHVAQSRRADIVPCNRLGLRCVWVNRPGHRFGRAGGGAETARPDAEIAALAELI